MMGENPASFASWTAVMPFRYDVHQDLCSKIDAPYCPTELAAPKTTIGFPVYFPRPSSSQGPTKPALANSCSGGISGVNKPRAAVSSPTGRVDACSKVVFSGIYVFTITRWQLTETIVTDLCGHISIENCVLLKARVLDRKHTLANSGSNESEGLTRFILDRERDLHPVTNGERMRTIAECFDCPCDVRP